ncbi:MAG: hypothetical protein Q4D38_13350 [Planctomycetia bacterium]|nr:hypothetical protein [Planctomycetia bacterium]
MMKTPLFEMRPQLERSAENYRRTMLKIAEGVRAFMERVSPSGKLRAL